MSRTALAVLPTLVLAVAPANAAPIPGDVTSDVIDGVVRIELGVRDMVHSLTERLAAWGSRLGEPIPDLTILTTQPLVETESSGFGWRDDPIRHVPRFHSGTDFRADPGTPVFASGDGVVVFAGRQGGYGNAVYIDHGGGVITLYGHMRRIETKVGAVVTAGTRIGQVGSTGRATGPHLHFEVRLDGRVVDPVLAMTIADIERESPAAGRLAAFALSPDLQRHATDSHGRPGRGRRPQLLW
jgi:murein DD-endopeptidase MepM/ murein hydrolase activator NlpD